MRPAHAAPLLLCLLFACGDDGGASSDTGSSEAPADTSGPDTASSGASTDDESSTTAPTTGSIEPTTGTTAGPDDPSTSTGPDDTGPDDTGAAEQLPPIASPEVLEAWLAAGSYKDWAVESGVHASTGPHGGNVRTYVNAVALASLDAGGAEHPEDSALVKELYGDSTDTIIGYAVMLKTAPESQAGDTWYWYERLNDTTYASDLGVGLCTGCHAGGADYILTPYPLQ